MSSLSLCLQFETNLMSDRKVIEPLSQLKSAKTHAKNYIKVKPHLVRHLLRNCLLQPRIVSCNRHPLSERCMTFGRYVVCEESNLRACQSLLTRLRTTGLSGETKGSFSSFTRPADGFLGEPLIQSRQYSDSGYEFGK